MLLVLFFFLSAIKEFSPKTKFYFAASSEMFGKAKVKPQSENTPFNPRSIYAISKTAGFGIVKNYREFQNIFCCSGILYNHESPRRGSEFVTKKITQAVAKIKFGLKKNLKLGNIDTKKDWGHAKDYVKTMWLMLNQKKPNDYVISTGKNYKVRDFAELAFKLVNLDYKKYIKIDRKLYRDSELDNLIGNSFRAKRHLKWKPTFSFKDLVEEMVKYELKLIKKEKY